MAALNFNVNNNGQAGAPQGEPPIPQTPAMPQGQPPVQQQLSMPQGQPPVQQPAGGQVPQGQPIQQPQVQQNPAQQNINQVQQPIPQQQQQANNTNVNGKKGKKNKKGSFFGGKKNQSNDPVVMDRDYMEKQYRAYKVRKVGMFWGIVLALVLIVGFAVYNTFFKHTLSASEAVQATLSSTHQGMNSAQWNTGVQGFLQRNLKDLLAKYFKSTGQSKSFEVDNIAIELNQAQGNSLFLCFFSADLTSNGETVRTYFTLPLITKGDGFYVAGDLLFSEKQPFSANGLDITQEKSKDDPDTVKTYLQFEDNTRDDNASKDFESTATNFFTLGYNDARHDVSDIYKGEAKLNFQGHFENIVNCSVYSKANGMGLNAYVEYNITLSNGLCFTNHAYMQIEKNSAGSYNILKIF